MIQQELVVFSFAMGVAVGSGGFILLAALQFAGRELHPETAQTWVFLWVSLSFTAALVVLNLDILVVGFWAVFYVAIVTIGASASYLLSAGVVGRPWITSLEPEQGG